MTFNQLGKVRVLHGSFFSNHLLDIPIKLFLSTVRFENRGELVDLGLESDTNTPKLGD